jgi:oligopeptide/dipeptide ABC transporter ATP-binding protein
MYAGRVIETGSVRDVFHRPQHPYTRALVDSIPRSGQRSTGRRLPTIEGIVPSLFELPPGCRFQDRCPRAEPRCAAEEPELEDAQSPARSVRCHFPLAPPIAQDLEIREA